MSKRSKSKSADQRKATPSTASVPAVVRAAEPVLHVSVAHTGKPNAAQDETSHQACVAICGMPGSALARFSTMLNATTSIGFAAGQEQAQVVSHPATLSEIQAALEEQAGLHVIVMYQSPWDVVLNVSEEQFPGYLSEWLNYHSGLLRLRQIFAGRLLLVSGKRLDDSAQLLFEEVRAICGHSAAYDGEAAATGTAIDRHTVLRAKSFEWMAPDYWDVYEALESCAWLGNGEPEYRDGLPALDPADLSEIVGDWRRALGLPRQVEELQGQLMTQYEEARASLSHQADDARSRQAAHEAETSALRNRLAELETSLNSQSEETKKREQALRAAEERARESSAENELLLAQLHQVQESLETTFIQGQEATRQAIEVRTELEQAKFVLTGQVAKLQNEIAKAEQVNKALSAERSVFSSQIGKLQSDMNHAEEAVKSLTAEKAALTAQVGKLQSDIQAQAAQAAGNVKAVTAEAEKQRAALQAEKSEQETALRATLGTLQTRVKEAESEAELLLQQLHQVQEELEHYYLRSEEVTRALEKSTHSFNRARRVVAQIAKLQVA